MTYPGGKSQAGTYQQIINLIPPHSTYIETHLGSGAIARAKRPAGRNILIDLDPGVIAAFPVGRRDGVVEFTRAANVTSDDGGIVTIGDTAIIGEERRRLSPEVTIPDPIAQSGDTAGLVDRTAGNGDAPATPDLTMGAPIATVGDARCTYELINADALAWLRAWPFRGDEFIYCDPPYLIETRRQPRRIYRYELGEQDHIDLLACLLSLPCKVMISGYYSDLYAGALAGWQTATFQAITRGGSMATEWLWMNYPRPVRLHEYTYLGDGFRERERIKRKAARWAARLRGMSPLERQAILAALEMVEDGSN